MHFLKPFPAPPAVVVGIDHRNRPRRKDVREVVWLEHIDASFFRVCSMAATTGSSSQAVSTSWFAFSEMVYDPLSERCPSAVVAATVDQDSISSSVCRYVRYKDGHVFPGDNVTVVATVAHPGTRSGNHHPIIAQVQQADRSGFVYCVSEPSDWDQAHLPYSISYVASHVHGSSWPPAPVSGSPVYKGERFGHVFTMGTTLPSCGAEGAPISPTLPVNRQGCSRRVEHSHNGQWTFISVPVHGSYAVFAAAARARSVNDTSVSAVSQLMPGTMKLLNMHPSTPEAVAQGIAGPEPLAGFISYPLADISRPATP